MNTLYRYRSIEPALKILETSSLRYSSLADFNDPFEGRYEFEFDNDPMAYRPFLYEMFASDGQGTPDKVINKMVEEFIGRGICFIQNEFKEVFLCMQEQVRKKWSFCCFSEVPNEILMWSHYAASHYGCCIEFSILDISDLGMIQPVAYGSKFPTALFTRAMASEGDLAQLALTSKYDHWSYEKELRLIRHAEPGVVPISMNIVRRIIFGLNTLKEDKARLISACSNSHIEFAQAKMASGYAIVIEPV